MKKQKKASKPKQKVVKQEVKKGNQEIVNYEIEKSGKSAAVKFKAKSFVIKGDILNALRNAAKKKDYKSFCKVEREHKILDQVDAASAAKKAGLIENTHYDSRKKLFKALA
jgi:hypothetical protein